MRIPAREPRLAACRDGRALILAIGALAVAAACFSVFISLKARQAKSGGPVASGLRPVPPLLPLAAPLQPFRLTRQDGSEFDSAAMRGSVWVVDFIFTRCPGPCRAMSNQMAAIAQARRNDTGLRFLTITVDPEYDTPEILASYAAELGADPARWTFLTGRKSEVYRIIRDIFKLPVEELEAPGEHGPIAHSTRFVLVDARSEIRGYYDGLDAADRARLSAALDALLSLSADR